MPKLLQLCSIICIHSCIIYSYIVLHYIIVTNQFWEFLLFSGTHALTILASLSLSQRMAKAKTFKQKLDALKNPSLYMVHPVCCVLCGCCVQYVCWCGTVLCACKCVGIFFVGDSVYLVVKRMINSYTWCCFLTKDSYYKNNY